MIKNINRFAINKNVFIFISFIPLHFSSNGQTFTGNNIYISGTSGSSSIYQNTGNDTSGITINPAQTFISTRTNSGGSYTTSSFVETDTTGVNIGASGTVDLFVGAVDPTTGSINGTNGMSISSTNTRMYSIGSGSSTYAAWVSSPTSASGNGFLADSTGTYLQSATDLVLTGTAITLTGTTNINTTGNYSTSLGSSGSGSVTMTSGSNSIALNNTLLEITAPTTIVGTTNINTTGNFSTSLGSSGSGSVTITSGSNSIALSNTLLAITTPTTIVGATNINTTGAASTSVGNTSGAVAIIGSTVSLGTNSGSAVILGNSSADSTVSLNGNRLQNIGTGVSGTDAVNLNQVNSLMSSTTSQITSLQNQANINKGGISSVSAMTNIPSLSASQKNNFGVGIGSFQGASAIAFGGNFRIKDNLVGKISASLSSGNYVTGAGLSFGW
jgi:hypothetical protein